MRKLHVVLIQPTGGSANCLSSPGVVILIKNTYSDELIEIPYVTIVLLVREAQSTVSNTVKMMWNSIIFLGSSFCHDGYSYLKFRYYIFQDRTRFVIRYTTLLVYN